MVPKWAWVAIVLAAAATRLASADVVDTTVCKVLKDPAALDGKTVRLEGLVVAGFDTFVVEDPNCDRPEKAIWLAYPKGTKARSGPAAAIRLELSKDNPARKPSPERAPVALQHDDAFRRFDALLSAVHDGRGVCLGCVRNTVAATLVGRLDGTGDASVRWKDGKAVAVAGFGNLSRYRARLVLRSVSDVRGNEVDWAPAERSARKGSRSGAAPPAAGDFPSDDAAGERLYEAVAAIGEAGDDNGVILTTDPPADAISSEPDPSWTSPDGLLFVYAFDSKRLKGEAFDLAMSHVGTHIADLRRRQSAPTTLYAEEFRAWETTVLEAMLHGHKALVAPGGYLLWTKAWDDASLPGRVDDAIARFLTRRPAAGE